MHQKPKPAPSKPVLWNVSGPWHEAGETMSHSTKTKRVALTLFPANPRVDSLSNLIPLTRPNRN